MAAISTSGCVHRMRASSLPVYPVPPMMPILVISITQCSADTTDEVFKKVLFHFRHMKYQ